MTNCPITRRDIDNSHNSFGPEPLPDPVDENDAAKVMMDSNVADENVADENVADDDVADENVAVGDIVGDIEDESAG